ncbi:hypothetical protein IMSAG192_00587 [Muribaculaceae bacterium]|nr:hypothetical protein IMSAG192_00587 [Muribaculaceae bacterium]
MIKLVSKEMLEHRFRNFYGTQTLTYINKVHYGQHV